MKQRLLQPHAARFDWFWSGRTAAIFVVLVLLATLLAACAGDGAVTEPEVEEPTEAAVEEPNAVVVEEPTEADDPGAAAAAETEAAGRVQQELMGNPVSLSDIADNTENYLGQMVAVNGEVSEILGPALFRINEGNLLDIGDEILVAYPEQAELADLAEDADVQVIGTVRRFVQAEIENEIDLDFEEDFEVEYESRPTIVATAVNVIEAEDGVLPEPGAGDGMAMEAVTLSEVADDPAQYMGQTVTVSGEVSEVIDPQVFLMNEGDLLDIGEEILVVYTADQAPADLAEDLEIQVTGTVRTFNQTGIDIGVYDLDEGLFTDYPDRVALVAESIDVIGSVSDITDNPEAYYGTDVTVQGDVTGVIGPNAFQLNDPAFLDADALPVVVSLENIVVGEGDSVLVSGTVRQFNLTEVEDEVGLDLEDNLFTDFEGQPVIVADAVSQVLDEAMETEDETMDQETMETETP